MRLKLVGPITAANHPLVRRLCEACGEGHAKLNLNEADGVVRLFAEWENNPAADAAADALAHGGIGTIEVKE